MPDWSAHCADLAASEFENVRGLNLWEALGHDAPRSPREAASLYRKLAVTDLRGAVTKVLGEPIDPAHAMRGDIALVKSGRIAALGIVRGDKIEFVDNALPITRAECVWKLSPYR